MTVNDFLDRLLDFAFVGDIELRKPAAAPCLNDRCETGMRCRLVAAIVQHDISAGFGQGQRDGASDAAARAGDNGDSIREYHDCITASTLERSSGLSKFSTVMAGAIRLIRFLSTFPGPTSITCRTPSSSSFLTDCSQRTGRIACSTNNALTRSEFQLTSPSTFVTTPIFSACTGTSRKSASRPSAAGLISGQ